MILTDFDNYFPFWTDDILEGLVSSSLWYLGADRLTTGLLYGGRILHCLSESLCISLTWRIYFFILPLAF